LHRINPAGSRYSQQAVLGERAFGLFPLLLSWYTVRWRVVSRCFGVPHVVVHLFVSFLSGGQSGETQRR